MRICIEPVAIIGPDKRPAVAVETTIRS